MRHFFMRQNLNFLLVSSVLFVACSDNPKTTTSSNKKTQADTTVAKQQTDSAKSQVTSSNNDTLIVDKQAAVFIQPDSLKVERRKKEVGEENFFAGADDYISFMSTAAKFLYSVKLSTLDARDQNVIKFVYSDKSQKIMRLDTLSELWNIYFFDPTKKPMKVDMTIIKKEYKRYFKH